MRSIKTRLLTFGVSLPLWWISGNFVPAPPVPPPANEYLLKEDNDYLLLETGDKIILE